MVLMLTADAQGANIVFEGTVKQAGTSALPIVKASPRMVVAIVDKILEKPDSVNLAVGDTVTVELLDTTKLPVGAKHTFHTVGWIYGKSLAVREVPLTGAVEARGTVGGLSERLKSADLVVTGRVAEMRAGPVQKPTRVSEHNPTMWREAVVRVTDGLKGAPTQNVVVRIPQSKDVQWRDLQNIAPGQSFTLLLHKDTQSGSPSARLGSTNVQAYAVSSPKDVLPLETAAAIKALIDAQKPR